MVTHELFLKYPVNSVVLTLSFSQLNFNYTLNEISVSPKNQIIHKILTFNYVYIICWAQATHNFVRSKTCLLLNALCIVLATWLIFEGLWSRQCPSISEYHILKIFNSICVVYICRAVNNLSLIKLLNLYKVFLSFHKRYFLIFVYRTTK